MTILLASFGLIAAAAAGVPAEHARTPDPNKIVCASEALTGSRLGAKKRCMSVQEWAETKRLDRQTVERLQMNRYNGNEGAGRTIQGDLGRSN